MNDTVLNCRVSYAKSECSTVQMRCSQKGRLDRYLSSVSNDVICEDEDVKRTKSMIPSRKELLYLGEQSIRCTERRTEERDFCYWSFLLWLCLGFGLWLVIFLVEKIDGGSINSRYI